ncbi:uncharacterized protein K489DRAFT_413567 [Dissoconium aciculare CBS 342.82]|uniref:Uncharacterized protein n=1 Tax=Dissoconium aciculare CBS 342.82 TaxID=1314786 RepID=A0A6J3LU04_9PEZI|nr:uncharacterized protein K489DRAFT_413567 [Dissoconium aciculare CBS 342.82]KAF1818759.1 hypothetical protein K489DRAFT_413567 [Dissoconium aciculare CBS 342.82]
MDVSADVAAWLSFAVTAIGLGGLISQANAINDKMDPFHANRSVEYLGIWFHKQRQFPWFIIAKPPPVGPVIKGSLAQGFCGLNDLYLTRLPLTSRSGKAGWATLLAIFHVREPELNRPIPLEDAEKGPGWTMTASTPSRVLNIAADDKEWYFLEQQPLVRHKANACTVISRTTLMTIMCLTNARKVFQYSDAAGFRAGYASYNGQWYLTWPIGQDATVQFAPHDSHSLATDVYPSSFPQRVDKCVQMLSGVVVANDSTDLGHLKVAFCGRKSPGIYQLRYIRNGFPGAHGSRHLYNMMGGKVYEVDFLLASQLGGPAQQTSPTPDQIELVLPSTEKNLPVSMIVGEQEQRVLCHALDVLPWSSLSWSIHRGMRDILVAFAKPVMDEYRSALAEALRRTVLERPHLLDARGWNPLFVRQSMGDMAASAVLAGNGNSGDLVRVVSDIVLVLTEGWDRARLDTVKFWRLPEGKRSLDTDAVVALTKVFVLEWSNEFDYQLYHDLPISLYFT